jgi:hypothetical protein
MIIGDRITYSRTRAKGLVVDIVIHTPHPILNLPPVTMCQIQWDKGRWKRWKQNSYIGDQITTKYSTWEEESNLQLDLQANRNNKLESIGI